MRPKNKNEYRKEIAEMFLKVLDEKGLEWIKEWKVTSPASPFNGANGIKYKGLNSVNLGLVAMLFNYTDPRWFTMVQIMDKKGNYHKNQKWHLKKGSKATFVEYWFPYDQINKKMLTWTAYKEELKKGRQNDEFSLCSRYTAVFNASCIEGVPELKKYRNDDVKISDVIEKLSINMNVPILYDGDDRAYYNTKEDKIHLPEINTFTSSEAFNSTALHELAHSTGHASRLNREISNFFGSDAYAFEELVAEMTSCFMDINVDFEISEDRINNHKAYVQTWAKHIKEKPDSLSKAIKLAQEAADYMEENIYKA